MTPQVKVLHTLEEIPFAVDTGVSFNLGGNFLSRSSKPRGGLVRLSESHFSLYFFAPPALLFPYPHTHPHTHLFTMEAGDAVNGKHSLSVRYSRLVRAFLFFFAPVNSEQRAEKKNSFFSLPPRRSDQDDYLYSSLSVAFCFPDSFSRS
jgi:hypothetical protein